MRILIIDDDPKLAVSLAKHLRSERFAVDIAATGKRGQELALVNEYDIILLDIRLPDQNGWITCANLRREGLLTPILMLTALDDVQDKIQGLDAGADDYLPKPFHIGELLARIRALTRRKTETKSSLIEKYDLRLDRTTFVVTRNNKKITLSAKEFAMLELFMMHPGKILSRETISEHVWDMNFEPRSNVIESFIRFLRQKIDQGNKQSLIRTIRGVGYMFTDGKNT
jgi:DNA-binding response OmpR family regulator